MVLSFDSVVKYTVCPSKIAFNTAEAVEDPLAKLYRLLIHQALLYLGKNNRMNLAILGTILNLVWDSLKSELPGLDSAGYLLIKSKLKTIQSQLFDNISELIATDYITTLSVDNIVLSVNVKAIFLSKDRVISFLYSYDESGYHFTDTSLNSLLYNYVSRRISKQDFEYTNKPEVYVFKTSTAMTYKVDTEKSTTQLKPIITNLFMNTLDNRHYPTPSINNCTKCSFKDKCEWSINGK